MSKKIKKQIKRSMPLFMVVMLIISTVAMGLVFNLNFNIFNLDDEGLMAPPPASAQTGDAASTTVTVLNAPPIISTEVAELPASTSTSPINIGDTISFTVTANDPESNDYFLIVCDANDVSPNDNAPPDCGTAGLFCLSASTTAGNQATCSYQNVQDPIPTAETDEWYAFVCDGHATEADCSVMTQGEDPGTLATSSPMYINHAPAFTATLTTDDNKDPGNVGDMFVVRASTTDSDITGGADEQWIYVCQDNNWSTTTGCAIELCSATSTGGSAYVECSFASSTAPLNWVAPDGTYNYYTFVMDWHDMPAADNSRTSDYTVNNVAPTIGDITLQSGNDIVLNMKNSAPVVASTTSSDVSDMNGCSDIQSATSSIFLATLGEGINCTADNNNCYQIASTSCTITAGTCGAYPDSDVSIVCVTTMEHYAIPTDDTDYNPASTTNWLAGMTAYDESVGGATTSYSGVDVMSLEAIHVNQTVIPYGAVRGGQDTNTDNATTTMVNYGNVPLDSDVDGTDMDKSDFTDYIAAYNQEYDLANFDYGFGSYTLSSTTPFTLDVAIAKPTSAASTSDDIYWGIGIPGGTTSGNYSGTNSFMAGLDSSDW